MRNENPPYRQLALEQEPVTEPHHSLQPQVLPRLGRSQNSLALLARMSKGAATSEEGREAGR